MKRTLAVFVGLLTVIILSTGADFVMHFTGVFPPVGKPMAVILWCLAIGYRFGFTFLGGWISARLDPNQGMKATLILTGIGCVLGLMGVGISMSKPELGPGWYAWGVALTGPVASWMGGKVFVYNNNSMEVA